MKAPERAGNFPLHFYSLDALRGGAALGVVLWHWVHFFRQNMAEFHREQQPLYSILAPFYLEGWRAVDFFFCLSGFVFYWRYSEQVGRRELSLKEFFVFRFARLYPLHCLTLVIVAVGQWLMLRHTGAFFVYQNNDLFHFVLQMMFSANWGLERGWSFNAPVWSVSYEMLLYGVFFCFCYLNFRRWWHLALFVGCGCLLIMSDRPHLRQIGSCAFLFFIGGLTFCVASYLARRTLSGRTLAGFAILAVLLWGLIPINTHGNILYNSYRNHVQGSDVGMSVEIVGFIIRVLSKYSFELLLFPLTIITLVLWEARRGTLGRRLSILGQISYSSYLLHFPLQMAFAGITFVLGVPVAFFYTPWSLLLFYLVLIFLSLCSYRYFERPSQIWLRGVLK